MGTVLWIMSQLLVMPHTGQIMLSLGVQWSWNTFLFLVKSSHQTCLSLRFLCFLCCQVESNSKKLSSTPGEIQHSGYEFHRPQNQMYKMKPSFYFTPFFGLKAENLTSLVKDQLNQL